MTNDEEVKVAQNEMTDEQKEAICYKSKLLNKYFDSYEELVAAEAPVKQAQKEKEEKALAKKADADVVQAAFVDFNAAKKAYEKAEAAASEKCNAVINQARSEYNKDLADVTAKLQEAERVYNMALEKFQEKHPEGYHLTLKDGDNSVNIYSGRSNRLNIAFDSWINHWFDDFFNKF